MPAAAVRTKSRAKEVRRTKGSPRRPKTGFIVTGRKEIEEKRQELRDRTDPHERLYGGRGYKSIARELQLLVSKDEDRSLTAIAADAGLAMPTLKKIWSGNTRRPSFETVARILAVYNVDLTSARKFSVVRN